MSDISGIVKGMGVSLEQEAFKQFGAAVGDAASGMLGNIFGSGATSVLSSRGGLPDAKTAAANVAPKEKSVWDPTRYAAAYASGQGNFDPKNKFLFKVSFSFNPSIIEAMSRMNFDASDLAKSMTFTVHQIDLPKVEFEYEEINYYNVKTKVLKSISNREISLSFYDDTGNRAIDFINIYMKLIRPVTRSKLMTGTDLGDNGFSFSGSHDRLDTASRGVLPGDAANIFSRMTIDHFFLDRMQDSTTQAIKLNSFYFTNPRLSSFDIGDLDYAAGSDFAAIKSVFNFDALHIETGKQAASADNRTTPDYPTGGDIMQATAETALQSSVGTTMQAGLGKNPFVEIIARQTQRAVQTAVGSKLHKMLGTKDGGAIAGAISGSLGTAAQRTLSSMGNGMISGIGKSTPPPVKDNSATSEEAGNLAKRTSSNDLGDFYG